MQEANTNWNMLPIDERINYITNQLENAKASNNKKLEGYWESNLAKFNELKPIVDNVFKPVEKSIDLDELKIELDKISNAYNLMLKDGIIDNNELESLINQMEVLSEKTNILKNSTDSSNKIDIINSINDIISVELNKMKHVQANS